MVTTLRDGATVQIRPLRADDEAALAGFLAGLTVRSRAFRFFSAGVDPGRAARRAVASSSPDNFGIVALQHGRIVGHAMYACTVTDAVEVAFAVADELQGRGLGTIMLAAISMAAAANGFDTLVAEVLPENHRMLDVFSDCGVPVHVRAEPGLVHVRMRSGVPLTVGRRERGWTTRTSGLASGCKP